MSSDISLRELFPSSEQIAIGGSDPRGTNTIERYQNALIRYGKQSFGIYWEVFRDLAIKDDFVTPYKPSEADKLAAKGDNVTQQYVLSTYYYVNRFLPSGTVTCYLS